MGSQGRPYKTDQDRIDAQTMEIKVQTVGSGFIQLPPQKRFEGSRIMQPPTVSHLDHPEYYHDPSSGHRSGGGGHQGNRGHEANGGYSGGQATSSSRATAMAMGMLLMAMRAIITAVTCQVVRCGHHHKWQLRIMDCPIGELELP
eukprot:gene5954-6193_t